MFFKTLSTVASLIVLPAAASAATVDLSTMHVNGDAVISGSSIQLTDTGGGRRGSAFLPDAIDLSTLTDFSATFSFIAGTGNVGGADGMTFMIQNADAGINALGLSGGGLGYGNINDSVAVEFDTYFNGGNDPNGNHVGFNTNGSLNSQATDVLAFDLESGNEIFAWVEYQNDVFDIFVNDTNTRPAAANLSVNFDLDTLGTEAFFGFSAATGGRSNPHVIRSFDLTLNSSVAPVPLPAGLPLALSGVAILGWVGRRKRS